MAATRAAAAPNVIVILADDIGYGDLSCYGAKGVKTPHLDKLAAQGIRFTDGHTPSGTCTPTRYAMLTGQYPWRKKGTGILTGDAAPIIDSGSTTLASLFKDAGYATGVVGKWHLGLGEGPGKTDWNKEIAPGPRDIGFDYSFLVPATGDRVPCVYVENHRVVGLDPNDPITVNYKAKIGNDPTGKEDPQLLTKLKHSHGHDMTIVNGVGRIGWMTGGKAARWVDEDMADTLAKKAVEYIEKNKDKPFFLYFATHSIHVPRVPHQRFKGTSELGTRGDVIHELDFQIGEVMNALDRLKIADNTLVIFSSDNGPVIDDGYQENSVAKLGDHKPAGPHRGGKYSLLEGGHRVPFIVRWPAKIKAEAAGDAGGRTSSELVCLVDLPATFAALLDRKLPNDAAPDSFNVLDALTGGKSTRESLVHHANGLAIRRGPWKLIPGGAAGAKAKNKGPAGDQLYNLTDDPGETKNLAADKPEIVAQLHTLLEKTRDADRSRP